MTESGFPGDGIGCGLPDTADVSIVAVGTLVCESGATVTGAAELSAEVRRRYDRSGRHRRGYEARIRDAVAVGLAVEVWLFSVARSEAMICGALRGDGRDAFGERYSAGSGAGLQVARGGCRDHTGVGTAGSDCHRRAGADHEAVCLDLTGGQAPAGVNDEIARAVDAAKSEAAGAG